MKNIKGIAFATDGNLKRLAVTFDEVDEESGKIIKSNAKANRVVTDETILGQIAAIEVYAHGIIDAE